MPLYEYECGSCGHRFERIQKFSDPPEKTCPKCGGEVHKLIAAPAVQFKGSGWYVTDYGRSTKDTKGTKDTKESKSTEATEKTGATEKSGASSSADSGAKETAGNKDSKDSKPTPSKS